jgi:hypothetical protein
MKQRFEQQRPKNDHSDGLECFTFESINTDTTERSAILFARISGNEEPTTPEVRRDLEASQRILAHRFAALWHQQGINVTTIYSCIRFAKSRDRIHEDFTHADENGNPDERRLFNTLTNLNLAGTSVLAVQRGLDGITDKASLVSWLDF